MSGSLLNHACKLMGVDSDTEVPPPFPLIDPSSPDAFDYISTWHYPLGPNNKADTGIKTNKYMAEVLCIGLDDFYQYRGNAIAALSEYMEKTARPGRKGIKISPDGKKQLRRVWRQAYECAQINKRQTKFSK